MAQYRVRPSEASFCGPSPSAERPIEARIAAATVPTKLAARNGSKLGISSRMTMLSRLMPLSLATWTYIRSRMVSTCARTVRAGHIQAHRAMMMPICSTETPLNIEAMTTSTIRLGMVKKHVDQPDE